MTLTLVVAAIVATLIAVGLHLFILVRAFKGSVRIAVSYVIALFVAAVLWFFAYNLVTESSGQVSEEGMKQFEEQKQMLDDMDDLQIELPTEQVESAEGAGRVQK